MSDHILDGYIRCGYGQVISDKIYFKGSLGFKFEIVTELNHTAHFAFWLFC